jgi:hypothetical protein
MLRKLSVSAIVLALVLPVLVLAVERTDTETYWKIRKEATDHSQVMRTMHYLTDVYGPRLTGSPNFKAAAEWAMKQMQSWGLQNGHLEPWDFKYPGWLNEKVAAYVTSPYKDSLSCRVVAWTPGTNGTAAGQAVLIEPPPRPTKEQLTAYLETIKAKVKGKIVLVGKHQVVAPVFNPPYLRREDTELRAAFDPDNPAQPQMGPPQAPTPPAGVLTANQINEQIDQFLVANGALVRVNDANRPHGQIRAFGNRTYDVAKAVPTVVLRSEDYGRIARVLADGAPVTLEFTIVNQVYPEGKTSYNVVAEIPGTDKRDEVVMLGGHLDSWHGGTGATDDATGVTIMMEAARILQSIGVRPRRTIRVALWAAEEQGLLGSQAYVEQHFGSFESPKPEFAKFNGYLNVDSGTGRLRGARVFGPPAAGTVLREALAALADLGVVGAVATNSRRLGGTDSTSFNQAGLPGISLQQDPIEYQTVTWHTNLDTYERVLEGDLEQAATVVAAAAYHLAMREQMLPRLSKEDMPAPPKKPGT